MKHIILTDIHFGAKGNSDDFNEQCIEFLKFVKEKTEELGYDYGNTIFLGDWFHNRNSINVKTLNYGLKGLQILSTIGKGSVKFLLGNHDLYYRDRRDVYSVFSSDNIEIIDKPLYENDYLYCPWLIGDEKLSEMIKHHNPNYVFGHFEIPSFSFNRVSKYVGNYDPNDYQGPKRILSGHFHLRQEKNNITYIGNCFSHDFSDVNDYNNKGFAILDTDNNNIEYYEWKSAPKYVISKLSELQNLKIVSNMYLKIVNDMNILPKDLNNIKTQLEGLNEINACYIQTNNVILTNEEEQKIEHLDNVDDLIVNLLGQTNMDNIKSQLLVDIYKGLE